MDVGLRTRHLVSGAQGTGQTVFIAAGEVGNRRDQVGHAIRLRVHLAAFGFHAGDRQHSFSITYVSSRLLRIKFKALLSLMLLGNCSVTGVSVVTRTALSARWSTTNGTPVTTEISLSTSPKDRLVYLTFTSVISFFRIASSAGLSRESPSAGRFEAATREGFPILRSGSVIGMLGLAAIAERSTSIKLSMNASSFRSRTSSIHHQPCSHPAGVEHADGDRIIGLEFLNLLRDHLGFLITTFLDQAR